MNYELREARKEALFVIHDSKTISPKKPGKWKSGVGLSILFHERK
jgi:hypothetical protein